MTLLGWRVKTLAALLAVVALGGCAGTPPAGFDDMRGGGEAPAILDMGPGPGGDVDDGGDSAPTGGDNEPPDDNNIPRGPGISI